MERLNFETFNAATASFKVKGVSVHPGSAKNIMVNAGLVAMEINTMLPPEEIPARTEGYEGFFHLTEMKGNVREAETHYIIRDHDAARYQSRCERLREIEKSLNEKYGAGTVALTLTEQYRNMAEVLAKHMSIVERAERAIRAAGLEPIREPVRGGTDLPAAILPWPALPELLGGPGGVAFHGPHEHIAAELWTRRWRFC